ncbi:MAG: C25 family cysteine peptidase [Microscillaceae bacterium]|nr:C25 family cysteine peptidase [Microscillaceae bacterium]
MKNQFKLIHTIPSRQLVFLCSVIWLGSLQPSVLKAQIYGNEWINYNQSYFKISVLQEGIYRLNQSNLQNVGVNGVDPRQLKLYHRGVEQSIYIKGQEDGVLDAGDYLEFYGKRNDGTLDLLLQTDPTKQVNPTYNNFSDTTAYFLTWSLDGSPGKRMIESTTSLEESTPLYHWYEIQQVFSEEFSSGQNYLIGTNEEIYDAFFDTGEGWLSDEITEGKNRVVTLTLNDIYTGDPNLSPVLEITVVGDYNSLNPYEVRLDIGNSTGSLRTLPFTFSALSHQDSRFSQEISLSDISGTGQFVLRFTAVKGIVRIANIKLTYPQSWTMIGNAKRFGLPITDPSIDTAFIQVNNVLPESMVYDLSEPNFITRITPQITGSTLKAMIPYLTSNSGISRPIYIHSNQVLSPVKFERVTFQQINPNAYDYLIVTHPRLRKPAGGYPDVVQAYADYRASQAGGGFKTLVVNTQQLYDQFAYGEKTPLGIRRFARYMFLGSNRKTGYVFLIGKAVSLPDRYFREGVTNFLNIRQVPAHAAIDLVPTIGFPPSDNALVSGLSDDNKKNPTPDIPIGRIPANNPQQILAYLNKVIEHETIPNTLWQKNFIHLSGGNTLTEQTLFKTYLREFADIAEDDYLGAQVSSTSKSTTSPVESINISEQVNNGVGLITFFGHSALNLTDIEIGNASDDLQGYRNKGRYPLMITNGCQLGGIFYDTLRRTLAEDWIFTPDRGAIGFIAHCYLGYAEPLRQYSRAFYKLFQERTVIGKPVGDMIKENIRRNHTPNNLRNVSNAQQMIYQGDPAVQFFKASLPDYEISPGRIFLESLDNNPISNASDSIKVNIIVSNTGILDSRPFRIRIRRTFGDGTVRIYDSPSDYPAVSYQDTLSFIIYQSDSLQSFGTNFLEVSIDYDLQIEEENENNNIATLEVFIPSIAVIPLTPTEYSIVSAQNVTLSALANSTEDNLRALVFEIDTTRLFNSPLRQRTTLAPGTVGNWEVSLNSVKNQDSTVYYWRVNYADAINDPKVLWGESSFTYIPESPNGWTQRKFAQFDKNNLSHLQLNQDKQRWEFLIRQRTNIEVSTYGYNTTANTDGFIYAKINGDRYVSKPNSISSGGCGDNSIVVYKFTSDGNIIPPNTSLTRCGRDLRAYYIANSSSTGTALVNYINGSQQGEYILIFTIGKIDFSTWSSAQKDILLQIGANPDIYNRLRDGHPYIILGQKGGVRSSATEIIPTSLNTPTQDMISLSEPIAVFFNQGSISSTLVGPAKAWKELHHLVKTLENESYTLDVYGVSLEGIETSEPIYTLNSLVSQDLSTIDAVQFPYLRLKVILNDSKNNLIPPQLKNWLVLYEGVTDGYIDIDAIGRSKYIIDAKKEGEPLNLEFAFRNNTNISFGADSLTVHYTITNVESSTQISIKDTIKAPSAKEIVRFTLNVDTKNLVGTNKLQVFVNPREVPEIFYENNVYSLDFEVKKDNANPILEVAFDGRQILDGEIVAPKPLISVVLRDDNKFAVPENENASIAVSLKKPCPTCDFEAIDLTKPEITWVRNNGITEVEFYTDELEDGIHTLQVQGVDASGNQAADKPYTINFEVVKASTITNFFPYPNPFSTSTRFVFTLTGETLPTQMKIQIMTVSGKVVREITLDELGPLRIGNNLTEYAWDGTDEFGDRLANGVYLYRVVMGDGNPDFEHRDTNADKAFKNGFGKLYILR